MAALASAAAVSGLVHLALIVLIGAVLIVDHATAVCLGNTPAVVGHTTAVGLSHTAAACSVIGRASAGLSHGRHWNNDFVWFSQRIPLRYKSTEKKQDPLTLSTPRIEWLQQAAEILDPFTVVQTGRSWTTCTQRLTEYLQCTTER